MPKFFDFIHEKKDSSMFNSFGSKVDGADELKAGDFDLSDLLFSPEICEAFMNSLLTSPP